MRSLLFLTLFATLTLIGCSSDVQISGMVKYTDGEPVKFGLVAFDDGKLSFSGQIQSDGSYKTSQKVPVGTYRVYLQSSFEVVETKGMVTNEDGTTVEGLIDSKEIPRVDSKYTSPTTSGITFTADGKTKTYDVTVEKP